MKRQSGHRRNNQSGIAVPAFLCLLFAAMLILGSQVGGDALVQRVLSTIAGNERFIFGTLALETGNYPSQEVVHTPHATATGREAEPTEEDLAESTTAMENAGLDSATHIPTLNKADGSVTVNNQTSLSFDLDAMLASPQSMTAGKKGPQVLIYHTHATEAYTQANGDTYKPSGDMRTTDLNKSVVRVGEELCKVLEARGIQTVHLTDMNDYPAYNGSYGRSLKSVQAALKKYPSIKMAIDVHRDAILADDGTKYKVACNQNGQTVAQIMLVMGTNESGLEFNNWKDHLNYAVTLQSALASDHPGLMRPINLRQQRFNLHLTPGSMLLEVGSSGNTLQEAIAAVQLFGETLATQLGAT